MRFNKDPKQFDLTGYDGLYSWFHGRCVATSCKVYSSWAPIHTLVFPECPCCLECDIHSRFCYVYGLIYIYRPSLRSTCVRFMLALGTKLLVPTVRVTLAVNIAFLFQHRLVWTSQHCIVWVHLNCWTFYYI